MQTTDLRILNDNKDNIVDNIKTIINAEFYNTYNTLSMYTINGINVATILKRTMEK